MRRAEGDAGFSLIELLVATAVMTVALVMITSFLISADNTMATGTARTADDVAAHSAVTVLEADIRFASNLSVSSSGTSLDVVGSQPACTAWSVSNGELIEQTGSGTGAQVATGLSEFQSLPYFSASRTYQGLVTVSFTVTLPGSGSRDLGAPVLETLSAQNMVGPVGTTPVCTP
jgi:prepilin-type N-terminal cleavage/methylation domain-containing protein